MSEFVDVDGTVDDRSLSFPSCQEVLNRQADRDRLMSTIALRIHQSLDLNEILSSTVAEVRQFLETDRVLIYRFDPPEPGTLIAADCAAEWNINQAIELHSIWYREGLMLYERGLTYVVDQMDHPDLPPAYLSLMQTLLEVRAIIVIPIVQGDRIWGVLTVHQCRRPRQWQPFETRFLEQLATQLAIAIQQAQLFSQVQQLAQREQLLNQIGRALNSSLDPDHILQEIAARTGQCFGVDRVLIFTITDEIRVRQEWRANEQVPSLRHLQSAHSRLARSG